MNGVEHYKVREDLERKIKLLNRIIWEQRVPKVTVEEWVSQFEEGNDLEDAEQVHALFLLSHFLYFGQAELRALLRALYRDLIRSPMLQCIRRDNDDTLDLPKISTEYQRRSARMRFLAVGNPSESGMHLLYYFRQENYLPKDMFINSLEIFGPIDATGSRELTLREPNVNRYVFIDDLCGSGSQAGECSGDVLSPLKKISSDITVDYFVLFATSSGLDAVKSLQIFDSVGAVFEFDDSFRSLEEGSRIFQGDETGLKRESVRRMCSKYGSRLLSEHPLGYKDAQLLLGFSHNTPDNTLPIFWGGHECEVGPWKPVFKRYPKLY